MRLRDQLKQIIVNKLKEQNSGIDGEFASFMAEELASEMISTVYVMTDNLICGKINNEMRSDSMMKAEKDTNGVWLYVESSIYDWEMIKVESIEEAIMNAMGRIENTKIIVNGSIIEWDVIDNNNAYYMSNGRMIVFRCTEEVPVRVKRVKEELNVCIA